MAFRHPIDRIYSAYKEKILTNTKLIDGVNNNTDKTPTFNNFMKYVSETNEYNMHWSPNTVVCNPCYYGFEYHIKMENFNEELSEMFRRHGANVKKYAVTKKTGHTYHQDILKNVDRDVLESFLQRFYLDYIFFGYDIKASF